MSSSVFPTAVQIEAAARRGALVEALGMAQRTLAAQPNDLSVLNAYGNLLATVGRVQEAEAAFARALKVSPGHPTLLFNLGACRMAAQDYAGAERPLRQVLAAQPGNVRAAVNLGVALDRQDKLLQAIQLLELAAALAPSEADVHFNLGHAQLRLGRWDVAAQAFSRAVAIQPQHARAWTNLGVCQLRLERLEAARVSLERAVALDPELTAAWAALADLAGPADSVAHRRRILALRPDHAPAHSSLLMCMQYADDVDRDVLEAEHRAFGARHSTGAARPSHRPRAGRRLRVAFLSADFRNHAMRWFALPFFQHWPRDEAELVLVHTSPRSDGITPLFEATAERWRTAGRLSDEALTALLREEAVDVLVDMSGHAPDHRLGVFAQRPAPLQLAWGDYVDTRGLPEIDGLVFDAHHLPHNESDRYVERRLRMPVDYFCWSPPPYAPPVEDGPAGRGEDPVMACFSEPAKVRPAGMKRWARILEAVPEARFVFNGRGFAKDPELWRSAMASHGVDPSRVDVLPGASHDAFLGQYRLCDLIVDTTPYSGGLTTCEALWMGVPVLTTPGDRIAGRHATAHLRTVGQDALVAQDEEQLVSVAVNLLRDRSRLSALRRSLRAQVSASPLVDCDRFARDFVALIHDAWDRMVER